METTPEAQFKRNYQTHLQHLKLEGLQPKTIEAYARAIRRIGAYFDHQIDHLSEPQLLDYFTQLLDSHSWSAVKLDLYGLKFYYTLYSLGLRLGEGLRLQVGDIDAARRRVHVRNAKGNKDRLVPLPDATLALLRRFWQVHRHPRLLFPGRHGGLRAAYRASTPLDRGGVQTTLRKVTAACGMKKN